jgi:hypothetical protein
LAVSSCILSAAPEDLTPESLSTSFLKFANEQKFKTLDFPDIKFKAGFQNDRPTYDESHNIWWTFWESKRSPATAPIIVWIMGGPGASPALLMFGIGGPFVIDPKTALWKDNKFGMNQFANVLSACYPYGVGDSGVNNKKWMNDKAKNMPANFSRFVQGWWDNHPEYQSNDIYLSGDSATGQFFPVIYHQMVQDKPAFLTNVKGFLFDGPYFTSRYEPNKFLLETQIFHLNSKKIQKRYSKKINELNFFSKYTAAIDRYRKMSNGLMKLKRYAPKRVNYYDVKVFTPRNRKIYSSKLQASAGFWIYLQMRLALEIFNSTKFQKYIGFEKMNPYTAGVSIRVIMADYLWLGKRDNSPGWKSMLNSGLKIGFTLGEYDGGGPVIEFNSMCKETFGVHTANEIENKEWKCKGGSAYKNWKNIHILKLSNAGHIP